MCKNSLNATELDLAALLYPDALGALLFHAEVDLHCLSSLKVKCGLLEVAVFAGLLPLCHVI